MKLFSNWFEKQVATPKSNTIVISSAPKSVWRNNMWVMTPRGVGIIFALQEPVRVHLVDEQTGQTIDDLLFSSQEIRQATYLEIPANRRGDPDKAIRLGYL